MIALVNADKTISACEHAKGGIHSDLFRDGGSVTTYPGVHVYLYTLTYSFLSEHLDQYAATQWAER